MIASVASELVTVIVTFFVVMISLLVGYGLGITRNRQIRDEDE